MEDLKPYPKYKTTKLNWLNQVPIDWDIKRTAALFHEKKTLNKEYQFKQAFQFKFGEIVNKKQIGTQEELKETYQKYTIVDKDDIVINGLNLNYDFLTQRVGKVRESGIITSAYISISPQKEEIEPRYACYLLKTLDNRKMLNGMGTGIRLTLSFPELKKQYLPLPPLFEQIQMANYLDYKVALINKFIKDKKKEIILLKEQKQAEINQAVTRGVNPNAKMKDSGISWIGEIPEHWDVMRLKDIFHSNTESLSNNTYSETEISYLDISSVGFGFLKRKPETYLFKNAPSRARRIVHEGDIIISTVRTYLKSLCFITDSLSKCIVSTGFSVLTPFREYKSKYLSYVLSVNYFIENVIKNSYGISYPAINDDKLMSLKIALTTDITEQEEIIGYIKIIEDQINTAISAIDNQIKLMQEYKTSLISDVVTGKVDVRNIAVENIEDEPEEDVEEMEETEEIENSEE